MRSKSCLATIAFFTAMLSMPIAWAGDDTVSTMASIMIGLQHFPSDTDKQKLSAIAESSDASQAEKTVAAAIANIAHKASAADQEELKAIIADGDTPAGLRDVASVVTGLNHVPSDADKAKLEQLVVAL
jgi:hypothetical protein